jgi:hypothetical protein
MFEQGVIFSKAKEELQMSTIDIEIIKRAIEDAQRAYDDLHKQLLAKLEEADDLKASLSKLEAFISPAKALLSPLGESSSGPDEVPTRTASLKPSSFVPSLPLIEKPLLQGGIEILKEAGRPLHLTDIENEFRKRRWKLSVKNGREVLRATFRKHIGTIFIKTRKGLYDLKERIEQSKPRPILPPPIRRHYLATENEAAKE